MTDPAGQRQRVPGFVVPVLSKRQLVNPHSFADGLQSIDRQACGSDQTRLGPLDITYKGPPKHGRGAIPGHVAF